MTAVILKRFVAAILLLSALTTTAQNEVDSKDEHLKFVVIITRHGVRSPTATAEQLNQYSNQPWPKWDVEPGELTSHGRKLMTIFGAYDRAYLTHQGLFHENGCEDAARVSIYADSDHRTGETAQAIAEGAFPGCTAKINTVAEDAVDSLFRSQAAGKADHEIGVAAIAGRIGNNPAGLTDAYRPQLELLQTILRDCEPNAPCPLQAHAVAKPILDIPSSLEGGKGDHRAELKGPLSTAATLTEDLLLEYTNGLPLDQVGWGKVDLPTLRQLIELHTASSDLTRRTSYLARTGTPNMMVHVLQTLEQTITQKPVPRALTKPADALLILVGHDTNLTNIAGMLNLSWLADGRREDTPPGGALVFELWQRGSNYSIRTYYTVQTLEQMRNGTPLTLDQPPARSNIFVPGCSTADAGFPCSWKSFQLTVQAAMQP